MRARGLSVILDFISIFPSLSLFFSLRPTLAEKLSVVSKTSKDGEKVITDNTNKQLHRVDSRDEVRIEKKTLFRRSLIDFSTVALLYPSRESACENIRKNSDCSKRAHSM